MGDRWIRAMRVRSEQGPAGGGYGGYSVRQVPRMVLSLRLLLSEVLLSQMYSSPRVSRLSVCSGGRRSASNWRRRMNTFCFSLIRSSMAVILQSSRWAAAVSPLALSGCPPLCAQCCCCLGHKKCADEYKKCALVRHYLECSSTSSSTCAPMGI